jgi:hypothetical protein
MLCVAGGREETVVVTYDIVWEFRVPPHRQAAFEALQTRFSHDYKAMVASLENLAVVKTRKGAFDLPVTGRGARHR